MKILTFFTISVNLEELDQIKSDLEIIAALEQVDTKTNQRDVLIGRSPDQFIYSVQEIYVDDSRKDTYSKDVRYSRNYTSEELHNL